MGDDLLPALPVGFRSKPSNVEAEQALLGSILINNEAWHRVSDFLQSSDFYEPVHGRIYAAMVDLIGKGRIADHITLKPAFDQDEALSQLNGAKYLAGLARVAETIINAEDYGRLVRDLALKRAIIGLSDEALGKAYDPANTVAIDIIEDIAKKLHELSKAGQVDTPFRSVQDALETIEHRIMRPSENYSTGLPRLDASMSGGIYPGLTYGIEAKRKSFKTGLMGTMALALMRQDAPFLYLALEMGHARIMERIVAHETACNAKRFRQATDPEDLASRLHTFGHKYGRTRGWFADVPGITFEKLRAILMRARDQLDPKVIFVDYWQRVKGAALDQTTEGHLTAVSNFLSDFGAANRIAMVVASQANRSGESYQGDGLVRDADWFAVMHKVDFEEPFRGELQAVWMDLTDSRDSEEGNIGTTTDPAFYIDHRGPVLRERGDW